MSPELEHVGQAAGFGLALTAVGLGTVFAVLALIAATLALLGRADRGWRDRERHRDEAALATPPRIDATTAVLIAAAVATYLVGRHRIRAVRRMPAADDNNGSQWSSHGRAVVMGSHVLSRRSRD